MDAPSAALLAELGARTGKRHGLLDGRASRALRGLLVALGPRFPGRVVALPSFLCHAPVAAVLAAGWRPLFVDVDPRTGQVPDAAWDRALGQGARVALLVHLFGSVAPTARLAAARARRDVFVIEDACQALGAASAGAEVGRFGDATLLSFGYSKQVDAGGGGALLADDAGLVAAVDAQLPPQGAAPADLEAAEAAFRAEFYRRKALVATTGDPRHLRGLLEAYAPCLEAPWRSEAAPAILAGLADVDKRAAARREKHAAYVRGLDGTPLVPLPAAAGDAPWRFACALPGATRARQEEVSAALRRQGVDVSNWYLPAHWMAAAEPEAAGDLAGTRRLSSTIFQFWLDERTTLDRIEATCAVVRRTLDPALAAT